jgi:hypothetical protein
MVGLRLSADAAVRASRLRAQFAMILPMAKDSGSLSVGSNTFSDMVMSSVEKVVF